MADLWLHDVRLVGNSDAVDVVIQDGRVESIGPPPPTWNGPTVDGLGHLALPGLVDGHAHLDKTLTGTPWRPHSAEAGLAGLIANEREGRRALPPVAERAGALLERYIDNGTAVIRTHVDVDVDIGLRSVEGVLEAAAERTGRIDVEVVAFPQSGMLVAPGTTDLLDAAIRAGASVVGGIDPAGFDGDAVAHLDAIFDIAGRHGCGVDVHLHDRGSLGRWEVGLVIERTVALGLQGKVTISHAFCLADGDPSVEPLVAELGAHRIGVATVAPGNVEPLPLDLLDAHGVAICLGQDGIRDLWSPWGDADMLSRAGLMAWRAGYRRDEDIARCVSIATTLGAAAIGIDDMTLEPGGRGDLVLVDAPTAAAAAVEHPPRSLVVHGGEVVRATPR